jgi:hypothetical protein
VFAPAPPGVNEIAFDAVKEGAQAVVVREDGLAAFVKKPEREDQRDAGAEQRCEECVKLDDEGDWHG